MAYNGRRGPNVSEYIANLNAIPSAQDIQAADAEFSIDDDLAMFTNTQFFDFDMGHDTDLSASNFVVDAAIAPSVAAEDVKLKSFELIDGTHMLCLLVLSAVLWRCICARTSCFSYQFRYRVVLSPSSLPVQRQPCDASQVRVR
jgi:hypothetical protein